MSRWGLKFNSLVLLVVSLLAGGHAQALQSLHLSIAHSTDSQASFPDHDSLHEHEHSHGEGHSHADAGYNFDSEGSVPSDSNTHGHHSHGMAPVGASIPGPASAVVEHLAARLSVLESPLVNTITPNSRHLEPIYRPPKS